jgi:hypothetical protein
MLIVNRGKMLSLRLAGRSVVDTGERFHFPNKSQRTSLACAVLGPMRSSHPEHRILDDVQ